MRLLMSGVVGTEITRGQQTNKKKIEKEDGLSLC